MIENVIFDLGNVLFDFKPKPYFTELLNDETLSNKLCDLIMHNPAWQDYDLGNIQLVDVKNTYKKLAPEYRDQIDFLLDHWTNLLKPIKPMFDKLYELQNNGYRIYILSNLSEDCYVYIKHNYDFINHVDGKVLSYAEHLGKPDQRIYELLLERYELDASTCLFLDDKAENVQTAMDIGINTIKVDEPDKAVDRMEKLLAMKGIKEC